MPAQSWHGRPACGRPSQDWVTGSLGSRRRLGGGTSVSEGSDAVGSVKGVSVAETIVGDPCEAIQCLLRSNV